MTPPVMVTAVQPSPPRSAPRYVVSVPLQAPARPWQTIASWVAIAIGAIPRFWSALFDQNIFWPDEIHQTLEQAHRFAFGYGMLPWEFRQAARSWVFPGLVGLLWKFLALIGVSHSRGFVCTARVLMVVGSLIGVEVGRRIAARIAGPNAGLVATLMQLACPLEIFFCAKVMTENLSGILILVAIHLLITADRTRPALAGAIAAFSIYLRYQNGLVVVGLLILIAWRDRAAAKRYFAGAFVVGIAGGMLDWITWSYPFQAFWVYVKYNIIDNKGAAFGTSPVDFFAEHLVTSMGIGLALLVVGGAVGTRRAPGLGALVIVYFVIHSLIPHKEIRFLLPILPLAMVVAGMGLAELGMAWSRNPIPTVAASVILSLALAAHAWNPTQREFGRADNDLPLWHSGEDYFVTMWQAEAKPDLCGIALVGNQPWWTGGYTYLHRNVPMYLDGDHYKNANYVVGQKDEKLPGEFKRIYENGQYALFVRPGGCVADPGYKAWLN